MSEFEVINLEFDSNHRINSPGSFVTAYNATFRTNCMKKLNPHARIVLSAIESLVDLVGGFIKTSGKVFILCESASTELSYRTAGGNSPMIISQRIGSVDISAGLDAPNFLANNLLYNIEPDMNVCGIQISDASFLERNITIRMTDILGAQLVAFGANDAQRDQARWFASFTIINPIEKK